MEIAPAAWRRRAYRAARNWKSRRLGRLEDRRALMKKTLMVIVVVFLAAALLWGTAAAAEKIIQLKVPGCFT